jgi:hypothetical protein
MTANNAKPLSQLHVEGLQLFPVWQFEHGTGDDEPYLSPVSAIPVADLSNRIVGTQVTLRNGELCWAILGNVCLSLKRATEQFLTLSIERRGKWFDLARYHDADYPRRGPAQLASFLGMTVEDVFPITYDISQLASGIPEVTRGKIHAVPTETLGESELIELALE